MSGEPSIPLSECVCPTCKSKGFSGSRLGPDRCEFCDGTYSNVGPSVQEIHEAQALWASTKVLQEKVRNLQMLGEQMLGEHNDNMSLWRADRESRDMRISDLERWIEDLAPGFLAEHRT